MDLHASENECLEMWSKKYEFVLDEPTLTAPASVEFKNRDIIVRFPEKTSYTTIGQRSDFQVNFDFSLIINKICHFAMSWMSINTLYDAMKIHAMFKLCLDQLSTTNEPTWYSENYTYREPTLCTISTHFENSHYTLQCVEFHPASTTIDIESRNTSSGNNPVSSPPSDVPLFQIYIGPNCVFCAHRDLPFVQTSEQITAILAFILKKINKSFL
jgi:hypothetical protein